MKTLKELMLMLEAKTNYNNHTKHWQVRGDDDKHTFKHEKPKVILKDAKPHVDHDAHDEGKKVFAYMKGHEVHHEPDLSKHTSHPVKFQRNSVHPFVHGHTGAPFHGADYVVHDEHGTTAYHKK